MKVIVNVLDKAGPTKVVDLDALKKPEILKMLQLCLNGKAVMAASEPLPLDLGDIAPKDMYTLSEWLDELDIVLPDGWRHRLASNVTKRYKEEFGRGPKVIFRPDTLGRFRIKASGYPPQHLWILDEVLEAIALDHPTEMKPLLAQSGHAKVKSLYNRIKKIK